MACLSGLTCSVLELGLADDFAGTNAHSSLKELFSRDPLVQGILDHFLIDLKLEWQWSDEWVLYFLGCSFLLLFFIGYTGRL